MKGWHKAQLLRHWRKRKLKSWQLFTLLVVGCLLSVYFLRQNNLKMVQLRNQVIMADETGQNLPAAIEALNLHVFKHMNTRIVRPIELVNTYNRRAQQVIEAASQSSNRDIYREATTSCERRGIPLTSVAQCAAEYALNNNPKVDPNAIKLPDKTLFIYSFASRRWAPDAAGLSLVATGVILLWLIARLIEYVAVRSLIRHRQRRGF